METENRANIVYLPIEQLSAFATRIEQSGYVGERVVEMDYVRNYGIWTRGEDIDVPEDAGKTKYYFRVSNTQIDLYRKRNKNSAEEVARRKEQERRDAQENKHKSLCNISRRHYELRREFVMNFGAAKKHLPTIINAAIDAMYKQGEARTYYNDLDYEVLAGLTGLGYKESQIDAAAFREFKAASPEKALLIMAFWMLDGEHRSYVDKDWDSEERIYKIHYRDNQKLDLVYYIIEELGYQCSDEERQMRRGTHLLFDREDA